MEDLTRESFWQWWSKILKTDVKLSLVKKLVHFENFSSKEVVRIAETEYRTFFKELCGYDLSMESKHLMIFNDASAIN
ncbi:DUF7006 family protein [Enterococcus sp. AZ046]|uniref:DUF7006 family protein n=1 Tax=Enterococcus sp. AZ046 TaxID=2774685 RepID=UPI003D2ABAD1